MDPTICDIICKQSLSVSQTKELVYSSIPMFGVTGSDTAARGMLLFVAWMQISGVLALNSYYRVSRKTDPLYDSVCLDWVPICF